MRHIISDYSQHAAARTVRSLSAVRQLYDIAYYGGEPGPSHRRSLAHERDEWKEEAVCLDISANIVRTLNVYDVTWGGGAY